MKQKLTRLVLLCSLLAALSTWTWAALPKELVPVGSTVGIKLDALGLVVVGFDQDGPSAARDAGMKKGDIIVAVNAQPVADSKSFQNLVAAGGGKPLAVTVLRGGRQMPLTIQPQQDKASYRLGIFVRDSMAGIGTVTFFDPATGLYGALGHGVNEVESMVLLPLETGCIMPSSVVEVQKGACGKPGLLKGAFDTDKELGTVTFNTEHGIFGKGASALSVQKALPVADRSEIHTGKAKIYANITGTMVDSYTVEVTKLFPTSDSTGRNMLLTITDERLLRTTGGIVQGMSGSPIVMDGKIIGAVTHVLVDNPTCGYGIFIENMLNSCEAYD